MAATETMQAIPATEHLAEGPAVHPFREMHVGELSRFRLTVIEADVRRWTTIHDEPYPWRVEPGAAAGAPPSILYYAGMNALAPIRSFDSARGGGSGGLARYWTEFHAPVPLDTQLEVTGAVTEKYVRRGRGWVEWQVEVRAEGRLIQRSGRSWAAGIETEEAARWPERSGGERPPEPATGAEQLEPIDYTASQEHITDFEGGGDHGGTAQGALSFGLLSRLGSERLGSRFAEGGALDVRFIRRVRAGEVLTVRAAALGTADDGRLRYRAWTENARGQTTTVGILTARA